MLNYANATLTYRLANAPTALNGCSMTCWTRNNIFNFR